MNLNQVTLPTVDLERAVAFYRSLGLVLIVSSPPRYARFECPDGAATLSLHHLPTLSPGPGSVVYFECDDLDERYRCLVERGVEFESAPADQRWLWREAHLRDPDGNRLCLFHAGDNRRFPPWRTNTGQFRPGEHAGIGDTRTQVVAALERMNSLVGRRSLDVLSEFDPGADVLLIGSEQGEFAQGPEALAVFFKRIFDLPIRIAWTWESIRVSWAGSVSWVFAEGQVILTGHDTRTQLPYRMTGVLERREGVWKWRHFHGAEPARARP